MNTALTVCLGGVFCKYSYKKRTDAAGGSVVDWLKVSRVSLSLSDGVGTYRSYVVPSRGEGSWVKVFSWETTNLSIGNIRRTVNSSYPHSRRTG